MEQNILAQKLAFAAILSSLLIIGTAVSAEQQNTDKDKDLLSMSIEQLMEVPVTTSGSLTNTSQRKVPAATTTITKDDIQHSGARNLDELLDIYVPNYEYIRHPWEFQHAGLRSIIADRDPKYLLLVNGRMMNEVAHQGDLSERDLPMLTDINHIEVIRGPGSAMYGPGAISMVINIITENANTFQGTEVTGRLGGIEEYYAANLSTAKSSRMTAVYSYTAAQLIISAPTLRMHLTYPAGCLRRNPGFPPRCRTTTTKKSFRRPGTARHTMTS